MRSGLRDLLTKNSPSFFIFLSLDPVTHDELIKILLPVANILLKIVAPIAFYTSVRKSFSNCYGFIRSRLQF